MATARSVALHPHCRGDVALIITIDTDDDRHEVKYPASRAADVVDGLENGNGYIPIDRYAPPVRIPDALARQLAWWIRRQYRLGATQPRRGWMPPDTRGALSTYALSR